ncbi:MAG: L-arabinose isomerase [Clostridiales Family XIII bacterium]|jgi:L-arabinose isomerase|nr:L-arabinose isomerase [Clostridiales Family XIII bacterium]
MTQENASGMGRTRNEFWFLAGSQDLYGEEVVRRVGAHAREMAEGLTARLPWPLVFKGVMRSPEEITRTMKDANADDSCKGVVVWMHTFSPSKMWISGLSTLAKPYLHLHTQYERCIPNDGIDMDYMNLHQSAHGDREHGFIAARMGIRRKVAVGYWKDDAVSGDMETWMRAAVGAAFSRSLKVVRFGDNMRQVAVTEGDKIEAQIQFGWEVNTWAVGELAARIDSLKESEVDAQMAVYRERYKFATDDLDTVRYQAREEIAIRRILDDAGSRAFSNTFEDLWNMRQLPGLATQNLMSEGYGYAGEGDWKTSALMAIFMKMGEGLSGGTSFIEDYTYDLNAGEEASLGAHMLEVSPAVAKPDAKPEIRVYPLGIGGKEPPARLVFDGAVGPAVLVTLVDMGGRFRLICHDVDAIEPYLTMPNLPVARVFWRGRPDFRTGTAAWILAGGAHHSVLSYSLTAQHIEDWAEIMGVEYVHIGEDTTISGLKQQLFIGDIAWRLSAK